MAINRRKRKFLSPLSDPKAETILVENRGRFCRFGTEFDRAALSAQAMELAVVAPAEVCDGLMHCATEGLTPPLFDRLYGTSSVANRAKEAIDALWA